MRVGYMIYNSTGLLDYVGVINRLGLDTTSALKLSGANLGNFAFKYAAKNLFTDNVIYLTYHDDPFQFRDRIDLLVLPEANLVNPGIDYGKQAEFIKNIDKPCFLLGVGAQNSKISNPSEFGEIPVGTINFLKEVSKRTSKILVRGEFTKAVINSFGIDNVMSIGCPSYMINPTRHLWQKVKTKLRSRNCIDNLTVTEGVYPMNSRTNHSDQAERKLFELVIYNGADYLGQVQNTVLSYGLGFFDNVSREDCSNLRNYLASYISEEKFQEIGRRQFKAFLRVDEWVQYYSTRSATIGTRIHGNILSLQSGTPSLPVTHDSRTKELCETMKIPHVSIENVSECNRFSDISGLYDVIRETRSSDLDSFRVDLARKYYILMKEFDLTPSENLKHLSGV